MLKALIIDDELKASDVLRLMLERYVPEIGQVLVCNDAREATTTIQQFRPDILFLDIRMPYFNGFDVLSRMQHRPFQVIFTTAYNEYTIQAIRFSAFDYLLKPIDAQDLVNAVQRYTHRQGELAYQPEQLKNIIKNMQADDPGQFRLAVPAREGIHFFLPSEIIRCEALGGYTKFFTTLNKQYLTSKNLGEYEELLTPYGFLRTHKSHLVNRTQISFIDHEGFLVLKDGTAVEVSRRKKAEIIQQLG
ncbi:response regulator transcription factor [Spirosoma sp. BT702]|uniref:Response regulator transcription factor n=1 Tax=Spirosoma profusum TaxID=2771354 RepID=A0A927AN81_9BACT|nr:LytTR family DNA-binding domain-containing protein [Spirosoma profusum]MBD2701309.1 response regulator transcription factor [Spirosoma profusum]